MTIRPFGGLTGQALLVMNMAAVAESMQPKASTITIVLDEITHYQVEAVSTVTKKPSGGPRNRWGQLR